LNLECKYAPNCCSNGFKDSEEFKQMNAQIASLQEQVDNLYANMNALRGDSALTGADSMPYPRPQERSMSMSQHSVSHGESPSHGRYSKPTPKHPRFQGPTSSAFSLDVAKTTLHNMGYAALDNVDESILAQDETPLGSPPLRPAPSRSPHPSKDPLWSISRDEAIRLIRVYEEEMGIMYPIIDIEGVVAHTNSLYAFLEAAQRSGLAQMALPGSDEIKDERSNELKMVMACALMVEGSGQSDLGNRLFESVKFAADSILHGETILIKNLPLLVLCVSLVHVFDILTDDGGA
jgi:hypothetical protein